MAVVQHRVAAVLAVLLVMTESFSSITAQPFNVTLPPDSDALQEATERAAIDEAGLVYDFMKATAIPTLVVEGSAGTAVLGQGKQNPLLQSYPGPGVSQNLLNLGPCATNQVHVHPRAAEIVFHLAGGTLEVGIVEENGGKNTLHTSLLPPEGAFNVPQGIMHWVYNPTCKMATTINTFNDKDPGTQGIFNSLVNVPSDVLAASSSVQDSVWDAIKAANLPLKGPSAGGMECLKRCNLTFAQANGMGSGKAAAAEFTGAKLKP